MSTWKLEATIEAPDLTTALKIGSRLPRSFDPVASDGLYADGLRDYRLHTVDEEGSKRGVGAAFNNPDEVETAFTAPEGWEGAL